MTIRPDNISANTNYTATTTAALGIISTAPTQNTVTITKNLEIDQFN